MSSRKFIGITIGPIFDTILESISPASMWFASVFFSELTYQLCLKLEEAKEVTIFSPYFDKNRDLSDGIGKYHDRILCYSGSPEALALDRIIDDVKQDMAQFFVPCKADIPNETKKFLIDYLQINYVIVPEEKLVGKNIAEVLNGYLDRLELMVQFPPTNDNNPFKELFIGDRKSKNSSIKDSSLFAKVANQSNQLLGADGSIRDIHTLAHQGAPGKVSQYFAVVNSDGDNVGKLLANMCQAKDGYLSPEKQAEQIKLFSKATLNYAEEAAKKIGTYGGMTIYAGGDDLLFIAPVDNGRDETILDLVMTLNRVFDEKITTNPELRDYIDQNQKPSLSFGVSVQYEKYPLYEAFDKSRQLLDDAKTKGATPKNTVALTVTKHSGQEILFSLRNTVLEDFKDFISPTDVDSKKVHSIIYTIGNLEAAFKQLPIFESDETGFELFFTRFKNFFDNDGQKQFEDYIKKIAQFYYFNILNGTELVFINDEHPLPVDCLQQVLRYNKFLVEKGGEE